MISYGQFCPVAQALEIVGERGARMAQFGDQHVDAAPGQVHGQGEADRAGANDENLSVMGGSSHGGGEFKASANWTRIRLK